jgi:hypothetical protein
MNAERFDHLLAAYGARPERWPAAERAAALAYATETPDAAARLAEAGRLDEALDAWTVPPATAALQARVIASATAPHVQRSGLPRAALPRAALPRARVWWAGAGLAAACALGVLAGAGVVDLGLLSGTSSEAARSGLTLSDGVTVFGTPLDPERTS